MKWKSAALIVGLVAAGVCLAGEPDDAPYLLETGIYMEETVGDLDRAMEAYRQIVGKAKARAPYVAQAYYRLGLCHLKKGQEQEAKEAFRKLLERYPDQEIAGKAREELQRLEKPSELVETAWKTVSLPRLDRTRKMLNLSNRSVEIAVQRTIPDELMTEAIRQHGQFVVYDGGNLMFPKGTTANVKLTEVQPHGFLSHPVPSALYTKDPEPVAWTITSPLGTTYELSLLKATDREVTLQLRKAPAQPGWRTVTLPEADSSRKMLDLSTGELVTVAETPAEKDLMLETMKKYGHFVVYDARNLIFPKGTQADVGLAEVPGENFVARGVPQKWSEGESGSAGEPVTWTITTTMGDTYEIVILEASDESVRLRYRKIRRDMDWRAATLPAESRSEKILDLSTGDLVPEAETEAGAYLMIETMKTYGHFVIYAPRNLIFPKGTKVDKSKQVNFGFGPGAARNCVLRELPDQLYGKNPQPVTWTIATSMGAIYEIESLKVSEESIRLRFRRMRPAPSSPVRANEEIERALEDGVHLDLETGEPFEGADQTREKMGRIWAQPRGCDLRAHAGGRMIAFLTPWLVPLEAKDWGDLKLQGLALRIGLQEGALPEQYAKRVEEVHQPRDQIDKARLQLQKAQNDREQWSEFYSLAKQKFERMQKLFEQGRLSQSELDEPKQAMLEARSRLQSLEAEMEQLHKKVKRLESALEDDENAITAAVLAGQLDPPSRPLMVQFRLIPGQDDLPVTYGLRTLQGSLGIVQVTGIQDSRLSVRYKLLSGPRSSADRDAPGRKSGAQRDAKASAMRNLGIALSKYHLDHDKWPINLQKLVEEHYIKLSNDNQLEQFSYRAGDLPFDSGQSPSETVVLHERYNKWPAGGIYVLFADRRLERIKREDQFEELLGNTQNPR